MAKRIRESGDVVYGCVLCNGVFSLKSIRECVRGQYLCTKCYMEVYHKDKDKKTCSAHLMAENKSEPVDSSNLMFPNPKIYSENMALSKNSMISISSFYKPSMLSLGVSSKKPVQCPHYGCNKTIAVSSLDSHFAHEHKQVATIVTKLEARNALEFFFHDLKSRVKSICLVLINLEDGEAVKDPVCMNSLSPLDENNILLPQQGSFISKSSVPIPKPFFIAMVGKVRFSDNEEDDDCTLCDGFTPNDRIIFFVTSNIATTYSYTIAVSTINETKRVKYYGPLLTMKDNYKALCEEGKGLILNHNHVSVMSEYGTKHVCVDVIIHESREDGYDSD